MFTRSNLRLTIIILTVITACIHLFLGATTLRVTEMQTLASLWLLNGVGYLVLLFVGFAPVEGLPIPRHLAHYALMGFAAITIVAWVLMSGVLKGEPVGVIAPIDKVVEVLLIAALAMFLRTQPAA
jgi:hypothetical protein